MIDWMEEINKGVESLNETYSFQEYMDIFENNPRAQCRPTYQYLLDMLNYFGKDERGFYKLFQTQHPDSPPVFGQLSTQEAIAQNLRNFQEEGFNNKFILLIGPNGSSKSSIIRKFMKGAEEYSKQKEGPLYSFSWVFPIDNFIKGGLGLGHETVSKETTTFAHLEDKDITAILTSELKDHPILLIPRDVRQKFLEETFKDKPDYLFSIRKSYFYKGDLSKRNRMIYDAMLKSYKGDHAAVLKHIRVERFTISRRYSTGAVTIEPQLHVDARMQQITMDKRLASLPPSLQSLNLFSMQGEIVSANRGLLEFSDLLKRPLDTFKYLLTTMETSNVNLNGILTQLDICFLGTSNEIHLSAFKQHPDFNSFKGRFNFVRVPYLLNYNDETNIYRDQIQGLKDKTIFEPHSLKALCLFAVMTRIRACQSKNYEHKKLSEIVATLSPIEKCKILSGDSTPDRFNSEEKQILNQNIEIVLEEFSNENLYEGKFGISPRDIKNILYEISSENRNITFIEILDYLEELVQKKHQYDFLNMNAHGDFHSPHKFIHMIKKECLDLFDNELRSSLGLVDDRSYEEYIRKYVQNINSLIKGERIKNTITGKYEDHDNYFIQEFEKGINLNEDAKVFRSHLISKLGAYSLDNPGRKISYKEVFPNLENKLKESFRNEQKKVIENISKNLVFFEAELFNKEDDPNNKTPLSPENRELISNTISTLKKNHGYSQRGAILLMKYTIKEKY